MTFSKLDDIRDRLLEFSSLMIFRYQGMEFDIDPFSPTNFSINYNGEEMKASSIDEVMNIPFLGGKCINDVAGEIEIVDWG